MRQFLKALLNRICQILVLPLVIPCKLEEWLISPYSETVFRTCTHLMALMPGLPGTILRRAFYSLTLEKCSLNSHIGFGSFFTHRAAKVEDHVYIGPYAMIGAANLEKHSLIGSRVSILSGKAQHELDQNGRWTPFSPDAMARVSIAENVWVGEGAILMADIGEGSQISAGAVITTAVRPHVVMAGNPARLVHQFKSVEKEKTEVKKIVEAV